MALGRRFRLASNSTHATTVSRVPVRVAIRSPCIAFTLRLWTKPSAAPLSKQSPRALVLEKRLRSRSRCWNSFEQSCARRSVGRMTPSGSWRRHGVRRSRLQTSSARIGDVMDDRTTRPPLVRRLRREGLLQPVGRHRPVLVAVSGYLDRTTGTRVRLWSRKARPHRLLVEDKTVRGQRA